MKFNISFLILAFVLLPLSGLAEQAEHPDDNEKKIEDCSCNEFYLHCVDTAELLRVCGTGVRACAANNRTVINMKPCSMVLHIDDCIAMEITRTPGVFKVDNVEELKNMSCVDEFDPNATNQASWLKAANACCTFNHELLHVLDPLCPRVSDANCLEKGPYENEWSCQADVANTVCSLNSSNTSHCNDACANALESAVLRTIQECMCDVSKNGTPNEKANINQVCNQYCRNQTSPDDLPVDCPQTITIGGFGGFLGSLLGGGTTGTPSQLIPKICDTYLPPAVN